MLLLILMVKNHISGWTDRGRMFLEEYKHCFGYCHRRGLAERLELHFGQHPRGDLWDEHVYPSHLSQLDI